MNPLHILLLEDTNFHADLIEAALTAHEVPCATTRGERREDFLGTVQHVLDVHFDPARRATLRDSASTANWAEGCKGSFPALR